MGTPCSSVVIGLNWNRFGAMEPLEHLNTGALELWSTSIEHWST